jgi:hypothetical protein
LQVIAVQFVSWLNLAHALMLGLVLSAAPVYTLHAVTVSAGSGQDSG